MRLFLISVVLSIACICLMSSSARSHSELAKLKAGIRVMEMSLEQAADESLAELGQETSSLSEKLEQQNSRLASLVAENSQVSIF